MQIYKAKIVGVQPSKRKDGCYYPTFEYTNADGEKRRYTRKSEMEITPFATRKQYLICKNMSKNGMETYEITEKKIAPRFCFFVLQCFRTVVSLISPLLGIILLPLYLLCLIGYKSTSAIRAIILNKIKGDFHQAYGAVIGYQEIRIKSWNDSVCYKYYPIVEYEYDGYIYKHISKAQQSNINGEQDICCQVYIDEKKERVFDEFEANQRVELGTLFGFPQIKTFDDMINFITIPVWKKQKKVAEVKNELEAGEYIPLRFYQLPSKSFTQINHMI